MRQKSLKPKKNRYGQVFLLCLAVSAALFLPHCIIDGANGGFFHYAGDFNDQMIPFYAYANNFIKQGGTFSWATDLGSGFVNAFSYYSLGTPFFWLMCLFPAELSPWLMVPALCLKYAVAGGGAYLWLRRWTKQEPAAVLGACLYAFSGFALYNVFFFFFVDVIALFPYLLAALDAAVLEDRRGPLVFWVAVNLLNNYFFFAGQAVFLILYFGCMCACRVYRVRGRLFARLAFETLLGCALGCVLLIPAGLSLLQNPRTIDPFSGYGYLIYGEAQQYGAIFYSMFMMPEAPYLNDMFTKGILKWTSLSAYLPMVGIAGGIAFCRRYPRNVFSHILRISLVCAFVPVLNSAFYCLNSSYYARWYYMPVLVLCAATVRALESADINWRFPIGVVAAFTAAAAAFALVPTQDEDGGTVLGVVESQPRFWAIWGVSLGGVALFAILLHFLRRSRRLFTAMLVAVLCFSFVYGSVHFSFAKYGQWYHDADYVQQTYREKDSLNAALDALSGGDGFYRLDAYSCYNNMGIWLDKSCIQFFSSTVAPHILEFYPTVGVTRDVNSKPKAELYALRGLLSVRYTLVPLSSEEEWQNEHISGWVRREESGSYAIYENEDTVPMGFTYSYYITQAQFESVQEEDRGNLLMRALVLDAKQIAQYGEILQMLPQEQIDQNTYPRYVADCDERRANSVKNFTATRTGFSATADLPSENLVFFSVPYDDGFSAVVNGQPASIEKVDNGLMAVLAPAGHSEIVFTYHTPGLEISAAISLLAAVIALGYAYWLFRRRAVKPHADASEEAPEDWGTALAKAPTPLPGHNQAQPSAVRHITITQPPATHAAAQEPQEKLAPAIPVQGQSEQPSKPAAEPVLADNAARATEAVKAVKAARAAKCDNPDILDTQKAGQPKGSGGAENVTGQTESRASAPPCGQSTNGSQEQEDN